MSGIHVVYVVNDQAPPFCRSADAVFMDPSSFGCCPCRLLLMLSISVSPDALCRGPAVQSDTDMYMCGTGTTVIPDLGCRMEARRQYCAAR